MLGSPLNCLQLTGAGFGIVGDAAEAIFAAGALWNLFGFALACLVAALIGIFYRR